MIIWVPVEHINVEYIQLLIKINILIKGSDILSLHIYEAKSLEETL
ncbi:hypothetical protein bcCo53_001411 (plasmid) [Borrelia coriaceae]|nr:hypothetical protein [Borrelia coriaceae]UPA17233.1 hypothetical protein bcCo53_001411 [Borrelia coriaceae]